MDNHFCNGYSIGAILCSSSLSEKLVYLRSYTRQQLRMYAYMGRYHRKFDLKANPFEVTTSSKRGSTGGALTVGLLGQLPPTLPARDTSTLVGVWIDRAALTNNAWSGTLCNGCAHMPGEARPTSTSVIGLPSESSNPILRMDV